jgi:hypothetical protein
LFIFILEFARVEDSNPQPTVLETVALPTELHPFTKKQWMPRPLFRACISKLLEDFSYLTGTDGTTTFANSEAETFFHGDRLDQINRDGGVVTRHYHVYTFRWVDLTSNVRGTEVELRTIVAKEWRVTATFFFGLSTYTSALNLV